MKVCRLYWSPALSSVKFYCIVYSLSKLWFYSGYWVCLPTQLHTIDLFRCVYAMVLFLPIHSLIIRFLKIQNSSLVGSCVTAPFMLYLGLSCIGLHITRSYQNYKFNMSQFFLFYVIFYYISFTNLELVFGR